MWMVASADCIYRWFVNNNIEISISVGQVSDVHCVPFDRTPVLNVPLFHFLDDNIWKVNTCYVFIPLIEHVLRQFGVTTTQIQNITGFPYNCLNVPFHYRTCFIIQALDTILLNNFLQIIPLGSKPFKIVTFFLVVVFVPISWVTKVIVLIFLR